MSAEMINEGRISITEEMGIATITFAHPMSNSLPGKLLAELARAFTTLGNSPTVKVIVLKSEGDRAFCGGASFDELISIKDLETGRLFFSGFANVINAMRKCPKLIIGRVQGKAVGGGVGLASSVDYCLATKYASIKLSELAVGIGPFVVGPVVERKIGLSAMSQLAINATEWESAEWAREKGLYTAVLEDVPALDMAVADLATRLSNSNPDAMEALKKVFWQGTEHWDHLLKERAAISGQLVLSDFTINAINAFKRK
jgi:methylglutaconyl-CoA hydratase